MERPVFKPVGTPVEELDTPALVVDLEILDRNIETVHSFFREGEAKLRPHVEAHRCPAIAHKQLAAGGTVGGVSLTTLGEAEMFVQNGFGDVFIANQVVTGQKIARLCALARGAKLTVAADSAANVEDLSEAAVASGVSLSVVVEIHTGLERCGVEPGRPAVELAQAIAGADGLHFAGLMTYEGAIVADSQEELESQSRRWLQQLLDSREMVEAAGLDVEIVSAGGTHNYQIAGSTDGVTEVPAGSYALMDYRYSRQRTELRPAAKVMTTVISHPEPAVAILDTGQKGIGIDTGLPVIEDVPGATLSRMSAEHGNVDLEGDAQRDVDLQDKVWLTPWEIGNCVNVYDYMNASRDGRLEAVWSIAARGRYR